MGTNYKGKLSNFFLMITDIFLVNLGYAIAYWLRFGFSGNLDKVPTTNLEPYFNLIPWLSIMTIFVFYMFDFYTDWRRKSLDNLIYSIIISVVSLTIITVALTFWYRGFAFPRSVLLLASVAQIVLLSTYRSVLWSISRRFFGRKKVLIVDDDLNNAVELAEKFLEHDRGWFIVEDYASSYDMRELEEKIQKVDIVLLSPALDKQSKADIIRKCARWSKETLVVPDLFELFILDSKPQQVDDMLVLSIPPPKLSASDRLIKRCFDLVVSIALLLLLSPVLLVLLILIPLGSKGSPIYKQERLGYNLKPYNIYKLRTMIKDAEKMTGPVLASESDPRITKIGKFLRMTRLDEVPQLINVIKGDMSLVGPRPEREFFIDQFKKQIPDYTYRMSVKPGITGLAQVLAKYSTTVEDKLRFDLMYVRNYSFALDIKILLQTIRVVLQRDQAIGIQVEKKVEKQKIIELFGTREVLTAKEELSTSINSNKS